MDNVQAFHRAVAVVGIHALDDGGGEMLQFKRGGSGGANVQRPAGGAAAAECELHRRRQTGKIAADDFRPAHQHLRLGKSLSTEGGIGNRFDDAGRGNRAAAMTTLNHGAILRHDGNAVTLNGEKMV